MRFATLLASSITLLAVLVLGVAHLKLRADHDETKQRLADLRRAVAELQEDGPSMRDFRREIPALAAAPRLLPPPPTPAAPQPTGNPGSHEEIQQIVASQLAAGREQERMRRETRREERGRRFRERIATRLELSPDEAQRFESTLSGMQQEWGILMEPVRSGAKTFGEIQPDLDALSDRMQKALQELLGPDKYAKLKEMNPGPPGGGPAGGAAQNSTRWLFGLGGGPPPRGPLPPTP